MKNKEPPPLKTTLMYKSVHELAVEGGGDAVIRLIKMFC